MADAIVTKNPVSTTKFVVNKYDDIDGGRVNQETPRGRLGFKDSNGRFTLPRDPQEANRAVFPLDWPKPLNPPPYFDGPGLNGAPPYAFSDGSKDAGESTFTIDPDVAYQIPWPLGVKQYDIPPMFYDLPVASGNKCLVFDEGVFTFGSGNYVPPITAYTLGATVYVDYSATTRGMITYAAASGVTTKVGFVYDKEVFGADTLTVKLKGAEAL